MLKNLWQMHDGSLEKNIWHDSSLEKIVIEYSDITVELETDAGLRKMVFKNYIAFDYIGQWDENIVEAIYEEKNNDLIKGALSKIDACNNTKWKGGGVRDRNADWVCVVIKLIDGVCIRIVCDSADLEVA